MYKSITLALAFLTTTAFPVISHACDIAASDLNNIPQSISPERGEWLLIQAWTLDCVICERQKPDLSKLNSDYSNFKVVNLSLDGANNLQAVRSRVSQKPYTMSNYISDIDSFRSIMAHCFDERFLGTPTYILFSPESKVLAVRTGPLDLKSLPNQLNLQ